MPTAIRTAQENERPRLVSTLTAGFIADPIARWCWPETADYFEHCPKFINAYGGRAFAHDSAWTDDARRGAALWLPPGVGPDEEALGEVVASTLPESKQADIFAALEELGGYHPEEPHWFLPIIAVDPLWQGQGLGSELMKAAVARCDQDGVRAYLESSNPRNITLYQRHGFEIIAEVRSGACPVFTAMIREPRT